MELDLSVLVPCYNEEQNLPELYKRLTQICSATRGRYEIVLVNDGSTDGTWPMMSEMAAQDRHITSINLSRNYGHQIALTAALKHCRGKRALIIDADLQDPPELLPQMMALMDQGYDVISGKRIHRKGESWFKKTSASGFYRVLNMLSDVKIPADTGDFRLINRKVIEALNAMPEAHRFIRGLCALAGFKQVSLDYTRHARFAGKTHYGLHHMIQLAVTAVTGFSVRPLRLTFYFGLLLAAIGALLLVYVLGSWLMHRTVQGWTSLAILIITLQSIQFIFLGIIGEYLARTFVESKHRPLYFIDGMVQNGVEVQ